MSVDPRGPKTHHPWNVRDSSRRSVIRVGLGSGLSLLAGTAGKRTSAQTESTPTAASAATPDAIGSPQPSGIRIVEDEEPAVGPPEYGGALRMVRPGASLENFNPAAFQQDLQITWSYLEPLVRPDPVTLRPTPWLADRWEWRSDGLELAFSIRENVVWHDGGALSAADAAFSYEVYRGDTESAVSGLFALVDSIEAVGDREVRVRFTAREPNWLFNAATLPIFSSEQYGDYWQGMQAVGRTLSGFDWASSLPIGTGPWRLSEWDSTKIRFKRFDGYWGKGPWLDDLEVTVEEGRRARLDAWVDGDSQLLWPIRHHEVQAVDEATGMLYAVPAASVMFAAFNFANPDQPAGSLWSDLRVREAASLAINRERFAEEVFGGFIRWNAAGTVAQPWAYDPALTTPTYDAGAASALLAEAGWLDYDGDGIREDVNGSPLRPVAIIREDSRPELAAVMARVARDLLGVGIGLIVEVLSAEDFDERWITKRNYDLIAYAYDQLPGFTDFDLYGSRWDIRTNPAGWNPGGYANAEADAAIEEFLSTVSIARQARAIQRLQRAVNDNLFGLWLGFPDDLVLVAPDFRGFKPDMMWQTARTWELWQSP